MTGISLTLQNTPNVTGINCGTSSPRLSGTIDLSAFPNLQEFRCNSNDITALSGYADNSNLRTLHFFDNKVTGSIPSLSGLTNLQDFRCYANQLTGPIPALSGLTGLEVFWCQNQSGTKLTGPIPALSGLTKLRTFRCNNNQLTETIPSLSGLNSLEVFYCYFNQFTDFASGSVSYTLGDFQAQNNELSSTPVNNILAAFVEAGRTTGNANSITPGFSSCILNIGGTTNSCPTGQGLVNFSILTGRGWIVTTGTAAAL